MTHTGTTAFLRQAHRNNWEQYLASLKPGAVQDWDICVLTASDERQAEMYRRQLDSRREAGLLPHGMQTLVLPDPGGRRIGSGGATLNALAQVAGLVAECDEGRLGEDSNASYRSTRAATPNASPTARQQENSSLGCLACSRTTAPPPFSTSSSSA